MAAGGIAIDWSAGGNSAGTGGTAGNGGHAGVSTGGVSTGGRAATGGVSTGGYGTGGYSTGGYGIAGTIATGGVSTGGVATGGRAGTGGAGGSTTSLCAEVPCYADLIRNCLPAGSCKMQVLSGADITNITANVCYANGIKEKIVARMAVSGAVTGTATYKNGNAVCFSMDISQSAMGTTGTYVFRDANGKQVATATEDAIGLTMTCTGGKATRLSQACMNAGSTESDCTDGVCSY